MRLGLLDAVPPQFNEATGRTDPDNFRELFAKIGVTETMSDYRVTQGVFPESIDECEAYLITGSPCSVYDDLPWIAPLEDFVRQCYEVDKPLVGICFGHQLIAQALGGKVEKSTQGWTLGLHTIEVQQTKPWLTPQQSGYALYFINKDQVVDLPPEAEWLGQNEMCPQAMYSIKDKVFSIQAHPEQPLTSLKIFTEAIKADLSPETYHQVYASYKQGEPDAQLFGRWIWNFLTER